MIKSKVKSFLKGKKTPSNRTADNLTYQFIHIPKTAGTSFRKSLELNETVETIFDYGFNEKQTHNIINRFGYNPKDNYSIKKAVSQSSVSVIGGHVPLSKYTGVTSLLNTSTILREPFDRLKSHYKHAVMRQGFLGDFEEFLRLKEHQNIQSNYLSFSPVKAIGLVGVSEGYSEFLEVVSSRWNLDLKVLKENCADKSFGITEDELNKYKSLAYSFNEADLTLYQQAKKQFDYSYQCFTRAKKEARATAWINPKTKVLSGWGFYIGNDKPLTVTINLVDKNQSFTLVCCQYRQALAGKGFPRNGNIGFSLPKATLPEGRIDILDASEQQVLHSINMGA